MKCGWCGKEMPFKEAENVILGGSWGILAYSAFVCRQCAVENNMEVTYPEKNKALGL